MVDFDKSQARDDISFYKKLARFNASKELNIDLLEYERRLRLHKSGKYQNVHFVKKWPQQQQIQKNISKSISRGTGNENNMN